MVGVRCTGSGARGCGGGGTPGWLSDSDAPTLPRAPEHPPRAILRQRDSHRSKPGSRAPFRLPMFGICCAFCASHYL